MTDLPDDLTQLWNRQEKTMTSAELRLTNPSQLTASLQALHRKEQTRIVFLNVREVIPAVAGAAYLFWLGLNTSEAGWLLFVAALLVLSVGAKLVLSTLRQRRVEQRFDNTVRGELERTVSQLTHRVNLLGSVLWWYILPLTGAIAIVYLSAIQEPGHGPKASDVFLPIGALVVGGFVYWLNKYAAGKYESKLEPYQAMLQELE